MSARLSACASLALAWVAVAQLAPGQSPATPSGAPASPPNGSAAPVVPGNPAAPAIPAPTPPPSTGIAPSAAAPSATGPTDGAAPSRRFGRRGIESLTPAEIDEVIAVAAEISPEWGEGLRERKARDPDGLREAISSAGTRLFDLVMLKKWHPALYQLKIEDLRIQNELKELAKEYRERLEADDARMSETEKKLREKIVKQVDLDLRASAMELQALDEQIKRLVEQLKAESQQRSQRIESVLEDIKAGGEPKPLMRPWYGTGRGPRGARRPATDDQPGEKSPNAVKDAPAATEKSAGSAAPSPGTREKPAGTTPAKSDAPKPPHASGTNGSGK